MSSEAEMRHAEDAERPASSKRARCIKLSVGLLLFATVIILVVVFNSEVRDLGLDFLDWVRRAGALGPFVFIAVYIVATVLFLPGFLLTIGAGLVFSLAYGQVAGIAIASVSVFIGATIGASLAFLLGRYAFREAFEERLNRYPKFVAIESAVEESGFKMTTLLRLSPLIPFNAFNYLMGVTKVAFRDYFFGSVGMIPGTIIYCFVGSTIGELSKVSETGLNSGGIVTLVLIVVGTLFAVVAGFIVARQAKKAIARQQNRATMSRLNANTTYSQRETTIVKPREETEVEMSSEHQVSPGAKSTDPFLDAFLNGHDEENPASSPMVAHEAGFLPNFGKNQGTKSLTPGRAFTNFDTLGREMNEMERKIQEKFDPHGKNNDMNI